VGRGNTETALKLGTTVYDASYIVLAKNNDITLVTEDEIEGEGK